MYSKSAFLLLCIWLFGYCAGAQQTVTIGAGASSGTSSNGASGDPGPMYKSSASSSFDYSRHHYLYTASELAAAGLNPGSVITQVAWYKANNVASNGNFHFEIWLENSSLTTVQTPSQSWSNVISGATQVYNTNAQTMSSTIGFMGFTLSTPFTYTGGALEVSVNFDCSMVSGNAFNNGISWNKDNISNRTISYVGSTPSTTLNNLRTVRPQFRITYNACTAPSGGNASNITTTGATVSWGAVSGSQGYEYVVNQSSSNPSGSGTPASATSISPSGLTPNTNYYAHIRNKCNSSSFSGWVTVPFSTLPSCYEPVSISFSNMTASTLTVNWSPVAVSQGYQYVINQSAGSPAGNGTPSSTNSASITGLTPSTSYYAHVRNICSPTDKSDWTTASFTTLNCNKPSNVLKSNVTDSSADLLWSQMNNASSYDYAVDFSNQPPQAGIQSTNGIIVHLGGLQPNSKYYIHIRSKCFVSDKSDWRLDSFVTKMGCYTPQVQVNNLGTNNPYAYWDEVPTAIAYEYALRNTSALPPFGNTIYTTFVSLNLPVDGKDYYLFVRSKCNSQYTFSSWAMTELRTGSTSIATLDNTLVEVYPNPAHDVLQVKGINHYNYNVIDVTGRTYLQGYSETERTSIDIKALPAGIYILHVSNTIMDERIKFIKE